MDVEVDQSGKVERTNVPTILAFSDGVARSLLIPAPVKRRALAYLRQQEKSTKVACLHVFAVALFVLLREHMDQLMQVTIDTEYVGHEGSLKGMVLDLFHQHTGCVVEKEQICFIPIGRASPAHERAIRVFRGEIPADYVLSEGELLRLLGEE